jgi:pimeloyl-ACP methyl ester carboxylesterase
MENANARNATRRTDMFDIDSSAYTTLASVDFVCQFRNWRLVAAELRQILEEKSLLLPPRAESKAGGEPHHASMRSGTRAIHPQQLGGAEFVTPRHTAGGLQFDADIPAAVLVRTKQPRIQPPTAKWLAAPQAGALGKIPLIVLSRGDGGYRDGDSDIPAAELEKERKAGQAKLLLLSSNSKQIIIHSGHNMNLEAPGEVIDAIREVVTAVQHPDHRL